MTNPRDRPPPARPAEVPASAASRAAPATAATGTAAAASGARAPERAARVRQRLRLIDACISALHIHGPSRTTVEKVVEIADMSPGIVRFYFDSKAAMLVASLQFLSTEFEERLLIPVAALKDDPKRALELLVDLYLDSDIASPRKVSVWYSFWGEASSRQEYYDICGLKDDRFAALVLELIERLILESHAAHLDADGVALGLIGVLEMLWQDFAFRSEETIDRPAARRRCMNYLRSVFPRVFAEIPGAGSRATAGAGAAADDSLGYLPGWAYASPALFAAESRRVLAAAWQFVGLATEVAAPGEFLALNLRDCRALVLRDEEGVLRAFHNECTRRPHALLGGRRGRLGVGPACSVHGLEFDLRGRARGADGTPLRPLALALQGGAIFVRPGAGAALPALPADADFDGCEPAGLPVETALAADWKLIVEQWLELTLAAQPDTSLAGLLATAAVGFDAASGAASWRAALRADAPGWTHGHYARLVAGPPAAGWTRLFIPPNQLVEWRPDGILVLQVIAEAAGRCRLRRFDYARAEPTRRERALTYLARRITDGWLARELAMLESLQAGVVGTTAEEAARRAPAVPAALAAFRRSIAPLLAGTQPTDA